MLRITWTKYVSNNDVLEKMGPKTTLLHMIRKKTVDFFRSYDEKGWFEVFDTQRKC